MQGDLLKGIALIALGVFSIWLFYILGERDATGPIFIIVLGAGAVYTSIKDNRKQSKPSCRNHLCRK